MLIAHFNAIEDHLLAISNVPANSGHSLHKGTPREAFIKTFLEDHLNSTVSIGTGEIIDCNSAPGGSRNQFDIVIFKRNYPRLHFGGGVHAFFAESVVATIEVKSTLDKDGIEQSVKAANAAKKLQKSENVAMVSGFRPPAILNYVVAYNGPAKMETAYKWVKEVYSELGVAERPSAADEQRKPLPGPALDGVFILGTGFLNFDSSPIGFFTAAMRNAGNQWAIADAERGGLLSLFLTLSRATSYFEAAELDSSPYLANRWSLKVGFAP